jgi:hypothetical protein
MPTINKGEFFSQKEGEEEEEEDDQGDFEDLS